MDPSLNETSKSHYSFGDSQLAATRLDYLAAAFHSSSRRFLLNTKPERVEAALDLGSGIGATTALLRDVTHAPRVAGYERSANFLAVARQRYPELTFRNIDVLSAAYPDRDADLIYSRFLLTHLHRTADVLNTSVQHLRSGGRLLLEETAELSSPVPALSRYYRLLEQMQAHYGQETLIGKRLEELASGVAGARAISVLKEISMPAQIMARLHSMNLGTWKADPFMLETHGLPALEDLERELQAIADSSGFPAGRCIMAQVFVERM